MGGIDFTPSQTKERGGGYCAPSSNLNPESIPARKVELDIGLVYITTGYPVNSEENYGY